MDYKKAYEEALERAKGAHNSAKSDKENGDKDKITEYTIQLTETIFPELHESKEEKNRNTLIDLFKNRLTYYGTEKLKDLKVGDILAWLEKQAEQKPNDKIKIGKKYRVEKCTTCTNDKGCVACENGELYEGKPTDHAKSNEEKAKEICGKGNPCCNKLCQFCNLSFLIDDVKQMAEWKDAQYEDERKVLRRLVNMLTIDDRNQTIIEDLKGLLS